MKRIGLLTLALTGLVVTASAQAEMYSYTFPINGAQAVPAVPTPGSGVGEVMLDTNTNMLSWEITFSDLIGDVTAAHFHGPAPMGANAGVQVGIGSVSGLSSPMIGSASVTDAQEMDIIDGLYYVNIHTTAYGGGEIRGQVVPEPASLALMGMGALLLVRRRKS